MIKCKEIRMEQTIVEKGQEFKFTSDERIVETKHGSCCYKYKDGIAIIYNLSVGLDLINECCAKSVLLETIRRIKLDGHNGDIYIKPNPGKDGVKEHRYDKFFGSLGLRVYNEDI
jgi:hypothetical protein